MIVTLIVTGRKIVTNAVSPNKLNTSLENIGLTECSDAKSREYMSFVLACTQEGAGELDKQILPQKQRTNVPLLGAFPVHKNVLVYGVKSNLQEAIEHKVNEQKGQKIILAVNSAESYYCFATEKFSYNQLTELKRQTYATDFFVLSMEHDSFFMFFEDDPACLMSFASKDDFSVDFVDDGTAQEIFKKNMMEWRINSLPSQSEWLEAIQHYTSSP